MHKTNISAEPVLLLRARRDVLDAHLGDCHLRHVDQSVDSKFPTAAMVDELFLGHSNHWNRKSV